MSYEIEFGANKLAYEAMPFTVVCKAAYRGTVNGVTFMSFPSLLAGVAACHRLFKSMLSHTSLMRTKRSFPLSRTHAQTTVGLPIDSEIGLSIKMVNTGLFIKCS